MATNLKFSDIQKFLDAVLAKSAWRVQHPNGLPLPHKAFWRQTGDYQQDYTAFTTGMVPNVGIPIMNATPQQELSSNFFVILVNPDGLVDEGLEQMPAGGPFLTDDGYTVTIDGADFSGAQIKNAIAEWLSNGFPA